MPEGDTIFRAAHNLSRALAGAVVTGFETAYAQLAAVNDNTPLVGQTIERVWAHGKHMYISFSGSAGVPENNRPKLILHTHMRMNGSWHIYRPGEKWQRAPQHARLVLRTEKFVAIAFDVPVADFQTERQQERSAAMLGPDLLAADFDPAAAFTRMRKRTDLDISAALLNQRVMAGVGNVYKSEVLFLERVDPHTPVAQLPDAQLVAIIARSQKLLRANVNAKNDDGIVTYTGLRRTTGRDDPSARLWVYGRGGEPCRECATPIAFYKQGDGARSTYYCSTCQKLY